MSEEKLWGWDDGSIIYNHPDHKFLCGSEELIVQDHPILYEKLMSLCHEYFTPIIEERNKEKVS